MLNWKVVLIFSFYFGLEVPFFGRFGLKSQNCLLKLNVGTYNTGQNIWIKIKKLSEFGQDKETVISGFTYFSNDIAKVLFLEGKLSLNFDTFLIFLYSLRS